MGTHTLGLDSSYPYCYPHPHIGNVLVPLPLAIEWKCTHSHTLLYPTIVNNTFVDPSILWCTPILSTLVLILYKKGSFIIQKPQCGYVSLEETNREEERKQDFVCCSYCGKVVSSSLTLSILHPFWHFLFRKLPNFKFQFFLFVISTRLKREKEFNVE